MTAFDQLNGLPKLSYSGQVTRLCIWRFGRYIWHVYITVDWTNIRCLCSGCNGLLKPCACGILCACLMDVRLPSELTSSPPFCFIYLPQTLLFFATLTGSPKILFYQHTIRDYSDLRKKKMRASWENWGNYTLINVRATLNSTTAYYRALIVYFSNKNLTLFHSGIRAPSKSAQETLEIFALFWFQGKLCTDFCTLFLWC